MKHKEKHSEPTALGLALQSAVQNMSKKKQVELISAHLYRKYTVFKEFKPLAIGIDQELLARLTQYDPDLILRALSNHCRRLRYIKALAKGGHRFNLSHNPKGEVTPEEQTIAAQQLTAKTTSDTPPTDHHHA